MKLHVYVCIHSRYNIYLNVPLRVIFFKTIHTKNSNNFELALYFIKIYALLYCSLVNYTDIFQELALLYLNIISVV